jgi:hypothetical protein
VRAALRDRESHRAVVPAALELGMVRLHRAGKLADPAARKKALEQAEETFLSVRGQAGESDQYRLSLGQVYYWLGKHAEGKKLFDELLKKQNRGCDALLAVSRVLRAVGSVSEARALAEEAWKSAEAPAKKHEAAVVRSLMFTDLDDKIAWLERADTSEGDAKASLASARGGKAEQDGKEEEAARFYRKALEVYATMPENAATLNNSALVHFQLYSLTHENDQFVRGMDKLDRALALQPSDSILLNNAASHVLSAAVQDVVGSGVDLKVLKRQAGIDLLPYLYRDQAGEDKLLAKLRAHPGYLKARGYFEKLMVLSPRQPSAYSQLASLYSWLNDLAGSKGVWRKLQAVQVDQEQDERDTLDYLAGKKDEKRRADRKKALAREEATLASARAVKGATFAVAAVRLAGTQMGAHGLGEAADAGAVVKLAEEAYDAEPSYGTRALLIQSLLFRAHQALAKGDADYAKLATRTVRSLGASLLSWVLGREGSLRDKALANADVKRALALTAEQAKAFPKHHAAATWALLRAAYPAEAERVAKAYLADQAEEVRRQIDQALSPLSASTALNEHWRLLMLGKDAEAEAALARLAKRGVPMPPGR